MCATAGLLTTKVDILFALFMEPKSPTIHLWLSGVSSTQQFTGVGLLQMLPLLFAAFTRLQLSTIYTNDWLRDSVSPFVRSSHFWF